MTALADDDTDILHILNDPEMRFWRLVHDLRDLGDRHHRLTGKLERITAQLADPARGTPQERDTATVRAGKWKKALERLDDEAHTIRLVLVMSWDKMPLERRIDLLMTPGWPDDDAITSAPQLANALWAMAKAGQPIPGAAPF
jgi:hypothetical protein